MRHSLLIGLFALPARQWEYIIVGLFLTLGILGSFTLFYSVSRDLRRLLDRD
jgi:fluoride ion exporter CrcB/FEX